MMATVPRDPSHHTAGRDRERCREAVGRGLDAVPWNPPDQWGGGGDVLIATDTESHSTHFALAFGEDVARDGKQRGEDEKLRKSVVREAFNSPFWPFVLATTSVGQEGLDFHLYCRDVMHWNLPSNPVDLEQREGADQPARLSGRARVDRERPAVGESGRTGWVAAGTQSLDARVRAHPERRRRPEV